MNCIVKHNGTNINGFLISYERTHKICTGVGILTIELENSIPRTFVPWDYIDVYENGDYKNRYYVSTVDNNSSGGTITLECQDKSKKLVDYFIPDQYTVDYPSYTRYWIEKFLDEAGVTYTFDTSSQGQLLSNYTSLGLTQCYDQIMMLLQMSGWYMFFDGAGTAIIGDLNKNLSPVDAKLAKTDILEISVVKDDKMLRNRALVWGNTDPYLMERVFAQASVRTKWNYDSRDLRTIVISNSNIPNNSSAQGIANQLVKEFARITVEKHLSVWGARNLYVGDVVSVTSNVYTGKGLITTFGTSMSKQGLVTNLILDERCPRLFGFFNFGDYVYVGTYGDGIWKKHIRFDHTWHDFSTGLEDLSVTDLHINNGIFSSVTASGGMYYTLADDESWNKITIDSLDSAPASGVFIPYSGIMGRATIVDKDFNRILYGVDNYSGMNQGDYFLTYSSYFYAASGILAMSGYENLRGWVLEFNPGSGMDIYNSYPISVSGNYNIFVLDMENDGHDDYVSVGEIGSGLLVDDGRLYNLGYHQNQPFFLTKDENNQVRQPFDVTYVANADYATGTLRVKDNHSVFAIDDQISDNSAIVSVGYDNKMRRVKITRTWVEEDQQFLISSTLATSSAITELTSADILAVVNSSTDNYTIYYKTHTYPTLEVKKIVWNADTNSVGSETILGSLDCTADANHSVILQTDSVNIGSNIYLLVSITYVGSGPVSSLGYANYQSTLKVLLSRINTNTDLMSTDDMLELLSSESSVGSGKWMSFYQIPDRADIGFGNPKFRVFQDGDNVKILGWCDIMYREEELSSGSFNRLIEYIFLGNSTVLSASLLLDEINHSTDGTYRFDGNDASFQLTSTDSVIACEPSLSIVRGGFYYNGVSFVTFVDLMFQLQYDNMYPNFSSAESDYIARDPDTNKFYRCNPSNLSIESEIVIPEAYLANKPYSNRVTGFGGATYWNMTDLDSGDDFAIPERAGSFLESLKLVNQSFTQTNGEYKSNIVGNFFIQEPINYSDQSISYSYIDLGLLQGDAVRFLVLQREGSDFNVVQEASKPIRVDISNYAPLLTVQDVEATFRGYYIADNIATEYTIPPTFEGMISDVQDYRYTYLPGSGLLGISKRALYVNGTNLYSFDADTMSGIDILYDLETTVSGVLNRIETTNYAASGQYLFVTTSGDNPMFYQKDCDSESFIYYSGLPVSRATIIRIDDRA